MTDLSLLLGGLTFTLVLDLVLVVARLSYLQANPARLIAERDRLGKRALRTQHLLGDLARVRASLNLALILARFSLAALVIGLILGRAALQPLPAVSLGLAAAALLLFWLEGTAEKLALQQPELWAARLSGLVQALRMAFSFLLIPLAISPQNGTSLESSGLVTEAALKSVVDAGQEDGAVEKEERRMIYSIFELGDTLAREIMVPRIDMLALEVDTPLPEAVDALLRYGFSRVPVYEGSIDHMLGVLYAKDLLRVWREGDQTKSLRSLLRPPFFVPEAKKVDELLAEMQNRRTHLAIVVDEYGGIAGLVTLEDIVEEILGEIRDEYDQGEEATYQQVKEGEFLFLGRIDLDDFNEVMGSNLSKEEAETLGGYIYNRLGRVPAVGDEVQEGRLQLIVEQVTARRIRKVRARWSEQTVPDGE